MTNKQAKEIVEYFFSPQNTLFLVSQKNWPMEKPTARKQKSRSNSLRESRSTHYHCFAKQRLKYLSGS